MNKNLETEHLERLRMGETAKSGLESEFWTQIVKPIIDSMLTGLRDATTIDVTSDKKAALEVKSRTLAATYLSRIEALIREFGYDGDSSKVMLEKQKSQDELFKVNE